MLQKKYILEICVFFSSKPTYNLLYAHPYIKIILEHGQCLGTFYIYIESFMLQFNLAYRQNEII